jgi:hypothetical protein
MNTQQTRRFYNVVFAVFTVVVLLAGFQRASKCVDDTLGEKLRASHREEMRRIDYETYNGILEAKGLAAAEEYRRTPQVDIYPPGVLRFYTDHQSALVFCALMVVLVLGYFVLWFGLNRMYGYVRYGIKGQKGVSSNDDAMPPVDNSEVTKGPPSVS